MNASNDGAAIAEICRYIESHSDERLSLDRLAAIAAMSKFHFARRFKAIVGVTPREYAAEQRSRRFKAGLKAGSGVDASLYDAGYGSAARAYASAARNLGMTPTQYRRAGEGVAISYATLETPAGLMMIGATDRGICFAAFGDSVAELEQRLRAEYPKAEIAPMGAPEHPDFAIWVAAMRKRIEGERDDGTLPLDIRATAFQVRVWKHLLTIPYGEVRSYREIARAIGEPRAARAVANACASNRAAVVIPCHRVIRESGDLGGYRWGLERKRALLDYERGRKPAAKLTAAPKGA